MKDPIEVKPVDVFEFLAAQRGDRTVVRIRDGESGVSARTLARRLSSVSGFYAYLIARGDTDVATSPAPRDLSTRRGGGRARCRSKMQVVARQASLFEAPSSARRCLVAGGSTLVALAVGGLTAWGFGAFDPAAPAAQTTRASHHIAAHAEKAVPGPVAEALSVVRRSLGTVSVARVKRSVETKTTHTAPTQTRVVKVQTHWAVSGMDASGELVMSVLVTGTEEAVSASTPGGRTATLWVFPVSDPTAVTESTQAGTLMITSASG